MHSLTGFEDESREEKEVILVAGYEEHVVVFVAVMVQAVELETIMHLGRAASNEASSFPV